MTFRKGRVVQLMASKKKLLQALSSLRTKVSDTEQYDQESAAKIRYLTITSHETRKLHSRSLSESLESVKRSMETVTKWSVSRKREEVERMHGEEKMIRDVVVRQQKLIASLQPTKSQLR